MTPFAGTGFAGVYKSENLHRAGSRLPLGRLPAV